MSVRAAIFAALVAASVPWSATAGAVLDPSQAQADVDGAMKDGAYAFCREPREPMSRRARALCPHAKEIPGCEGFVAACDRAEKRASGAHSGGGRSPWVVPGFLGTLAQALVWLLVGVLVLAVLVPIVRALVRIRRDQKLAEPIADEAPAPEAAPLVKLPATTDEDLLLRRAEELARRGEYAAALQLYLAASLRALDKRGAVRLARDRTNGEYVRACTDAGARPALRDIVREVDRAQFGGESPTPEAVSRAAQRAVAIVRALPAMLLALAIVCLLGGCAGGAGAKGGPGTGDDPAGDQLLYDVLRRQGVKATPLATSLASLPMPKPDERTAAVVVDTERTELDEDTIEHVLDWVDAGGVLVLAGDADRWPKKLGAAHAASKEHGITARRLLAPGTVGGKEDDDSSDEADAPVFSETTEHGELTTGDAVGFSGVTTRVAWFGDAMTYAALTARGKGYVLGIASDELMTNAGLARPGNAAAMVDIFSAADRLELRIAQPDDGVAPPATPIAALTRAGLGLGMVHALFAALALFLAVGVRLARPKPAPPPLRRAFAEHVEAVGALYARTRSAPHALAAYARFADERLRARMPRGTSDVPAFLASRAGLPLDVCQRVWTRAAAAKAGAPPLGDELAVLKELSAVYSAAMAQDR